jgi:hypothetical protein
VHGVEVAGVLEMALLAVAVVLVFWHPRRRARTAALDGDDQILKPSAGGSRG